MKHILRPAFGIVLAAGLTLSASAAEIHSQDVYCFGGGEFAPGEAALSGICLTGLPGREHGALMLGERMLRPGDVLTAQQVKEMTFVSGTAQEDATATITYLPVFANGTAGEATMTLSIRGRENKAPIAEDCAFETYKNLELAGALKVRDPEGQEMTFALTRPPRRGTVEISPEGKFTYTPKKNKVGVDSFTFTAADPAGKVSREATVTVSILKPTDARQYTDTAGRSCRFTAEWMKHTGIFVGESIGGSPCFSPDKPVSRGEFVTMLVRALSLPTDEAVTETGYSDVPQWLRPYLAAAIRSGVTSRMETAETFEPDAPVSAEDAAAMLCSALGLECREQPAAAAQEGTVGISSREIAAQNGFCFPSPALTRSDAAGILYQASRYPK